MMDPILSMIGICRKAGKIEAGEEPVDAAVRYRLARDERLDPQRAAEVRFARFFNNTPIAIATVDRAGGSGFVVRDRAEVTAERVVIASTVTGRNTGAGARTRSRRLSGSAGTSVMTPAHPVDSRERCMQS